MVNYFGPKLFQAYTTIQVKHFDQHLQVVQNGLTLAIRLYMVLGQKQSRQHLSWQAFEHSQLPLNGSPMMAISRPCAFLILKNLERWMRS